MDWLIRAKDYLEALSYFTILVGFPLALFQYWKTAHKEQLDRDYGTYNALDEKYLEFQKLCLECPELDIFDIEDSTKRPLNGVEKKKELIAFTMLFSIFERAFLMYFDADEDIKRRQWIGWHDYISGYCKRENFRDAWKVSGSTFDTDYQNYMEKILSGSCSPTV